MNHRIDVAKTERPGAGILDHIAIAVTNLEHSIELFTGLFGLEVVERRSTRGTSTGMISAVLDGSGVPIVLVQGTEPSSQVSQFVAIHGPGVQHVAFRVDDIAKKVSEFSEFDLHPSFPIIEGAGIRQVFIDGRAMGPRIELIERQGGTFNDASIRQLFLLMEQRNLV